MLKWIVERVLPGIAGAGLTFALVWILGGVNGMFGTLADRVGQRWIPNGTIIFLATKDVNVPTKCPVNWEYVGIVGLLSDPDGEASFRRYFEDNREWPDPMKVQAGRVHSVICVKEK